MGWFWDELGRELWWVEVVEDALVEAEEVRGRRKWRTAGIRIHSETRSDNQIPYILFLFICPGTVCHMEEICIVNSN